MHAIRRESIILLDSKEAFDFRAETELLISFCVHLMLLLVL